MQSPLKRIASNSILLYIRSIIMMIIAIYTSRILLSTLGVDNFGIYNLVGSVIAMFTSIKSVLSSSVQRFLNYYKGLGDDDELNKIFNSSILIHLFLGILFGVVVGVLGYYFITRILTFPIGQVADALFVFHCSLLAVIVTIITLPYDSAIIANEAMGFYSKISIIDSALKCIFVFILPLVPYNFLYTYSVLILIETVCLRFATIIYCRSYAECKIKKRIYSRKTIKELSSFAGWNFLGCTASSLIEEGTNFILNIFGGVIANAARGIANQVKSAVTLLSNNVVLASQPYLMQKVSNTDNKNFFTLIILQSRALFFIISITILPLYIYSDEILNVWLKTVPNYSSDFMRAILIYLLVSCFQKPLDLLFKSYGKIAEYQILDSIVFLSALPIGYFSLKYGAPLHFIYYACALARIFEYIVILRLSQNTHHISIKNYLSSVVLPSIISFAVLIAIYFLFSIYFVSSNILSLIAFSFLSCILYGTFLYCLIITKYEKYIIGKIIKFKR